MVTTLGDASPLVSKLPRAPVLRRMSEMLLELLGE